MSSVTFEVDDPGEPQVVVDADDAPFEPFDTPGFGESFGGEVDDGAPLVDETRIREFLKGAGRAGNSLAHDPDVPDQWVFLPEEIDAIAPPLTSIVNRHRWMRAAVAKGDGLFLGLALAGYTGRNLEDGRIARQIRKESDPHGDQPAEVRGPGPDDPSEDRRSGERVHGGAGGSGVPAHEVVGVGVDAGGS